MSCQSRERLRWRFARLRNPQRIALAEARIAEQGAYDTGVSMLA